MGGSIERPALGRGLSTKLLALVVAFLFVGEVLVFVPSIARFRLSYLDQMVAAAHIATLAASHHPPTGIDPQLEQLLLRRVGARSVTLWEPDAHVMLGTAEPVDRMFDLRSRGPLQLILDAFETLAGDGGRVIRVIAAAPQDPDILVDVTLDERSMRRAMVAYADRILALSIVLSLIVASLFWLSLRGLVLRPLAIITGRIADFRRSPEDASLDIVPARRRDEIGIVERELLAMQRGLRQALKQQMRLAALGAAVGQISHDLKNMLASAVLLSDRLEQSADPPVRALAPRLIATLDRAVRLSTETLRFAREPIPEPRFERFLLRPLLEEVAAEVTGQVEGVAWQNDVPAELAVRADRDQLFRVLLNLGHNSREALAGQPGRVTCRARRIESGVELTLSDTGPGVPASLLPQLFRTFFRSSKPDGTGLGLAICREIMRAHGGDIELVGTGETGTSFRLTIPDREPA